MKKLGLYPDEAVALHGAPSGFEALLTPLPNGARLLRSTRASCPLSIWFPKSRAELERDMARRAKALGTRGIWICWPKKSSGIVSDSGRERHPRQRPRARTGRLQSVRD
ncbi:MAG: hypothetical protein QM756_32820 [Polyangiaceae bacterium]